MTNFMPYLNIGVNLVPAPITGGTSKQCLLIGQSITGGQIYLSKNGFPQPNYYIPFLLPSFENGQSALNYLSNYGISSQMGYNFSLIIPQHPNSVNYLNGTTVITWSSIPNGFTQLVGFALSGNVVQLSLTAPILSASISGGIATLIVSGTVAFTLTAGITINGTNNVAYPDPNNSDPIALMVWDFYQSALSANTPTDGVPSAYISILSDRDVSISAINTPIELIVPTNVTTALGITTLSYTYTGGIGTLANFGYLPTTAYGNTTVTQLNSNATGTFAGYSISPTSTTTGTVNILVANVTGTFVTTAGDTISVVLDNTINAFNFINGINLYASVMQFPINTLTNINTTYADFYNGNTTINQPNQVLNSHYGTYAIAGNITSLPNQATSLPVANDRTKILVSYPYIAQFGDIPYDNSSGNVASGRIASAIAYMLANGDYTSAFPPLTGATINHLPVSSISSSISYNTLGGGTGNLAVINGWLPLAPNSGNVVTFLQSNTTMTTLPNTQVPDTEFRYIHVGDCIKFTKYQIAQLYLIISKLPNNQGTVLISTNFLRQFRNGIISVLYFLQNYGIVQNVALYEKLVSVIQDPVNPNQVDAVIPEQIIPQLNGCSGTITVFSSLYNFNNNAG